jgi:hypothetical protein
VLPRRRLGRLRHRRHRLHRAGPPDRMGHDAGAARAAVRGRGLRAHDRRLRLRPARRPAGPPGDPRPHGPLLRHGEPRFGLKPLDRNAHPAPVRDRSRAGRRPAQRDHPRLGKLPGGPPLLPRVDRDQQLRRRRRPRRRGVGALDRRLWVAFGPGARRGPAAPAGPGPLGDPAGIRPLPGDAGRPRRPRRGHAPADHPRHRDPRRQALCGRPQARGSSR